MAAAWGRWGHGMHLCESFKAGSVWRSTFRQVGSMYPTIVPRGPAHAPHPTQEGDLLVIVLEYVRGGSLDRARRKLGGRMTEQQALELVMAPLLRTLHYLHTQTIVHRDIKPVRPWQVGWGCDGSWHFLEAMPGSYASKLCLEAMPGSYAAPAKQEGCRAV